MTAPGITAQSLKRLFQGRVLAEQWTLRRARRRWLPGRRGFYSLWADVMRQPIDDEADGPFTAIVLSHARQFNIDLMTRIALTTPSIGRVIVSNDNPNVDIADWVDVRSPRLTLRNDVGINQNRRFLIAAESDGEFFWAPDDDCFVRPDDLERACRAYLQDPAVPATPMGMNLSSAGEYRIKLTAPPERPVDIANRMYFFTAEHARRWVELADAMGWMGEDDTLLRTKPYDDVFLSFTGPSHPRLIDLPIIDCVTHNIETISSFAREGFVEERFALASELRQLVGRTPVDEDSPTPSSAPGRSRDEG